MRVAFTLDILEGWTFGIGFYHYKNPCRKKLIDDVREFKIFIGRIALGGIGVKHASKV